MHLYSDGGLDISPDGKYLIVCSILYDVSKESRQFANENSLGMLLKSPDIDSDNQFGDLLDKIDGLTISDSSNSDKCNIIYVLVYL